MVMPMCVPRAAAVLGALGLIPFVGLVLGVVVSDAPS